LFNTNNVDSILIFIVIKKTSIIQYKQITKG